MEQDIRTKMGSIWSHQQMDSWLPMIMSAINEKPIYKLAIDKWSEEMQIEIAVEECAELIKAIQKFKRHGPSADLIHGLIEEIADVSIMIEQLTIIFGVDHVEAWKQIKLERLEKRIKE